MNIALWILQVLLALHTAMGALWKFFNPAQTVSSLQSIPHGAWLALSVVELLCAVALLLPAASRRFAMLAPVAAIVIAAEMVLFTVVHVRSSESDYGHVAYWLVVAAVCAFVAYGRLVPKPLHRME
jgi:DoxX-like protein